MRPIVEIREYGNGKYFKAKLRPGDTKRSYKRIEWRLEEIRDGINGSLRRLRIFPENLFCECEDGREILSKIF